MASPWMIFRIPDGCRRSGSRGEDAIEGGGMDTEGVRYFIYGLSFLEKPLGKVLMLTIHFFGAAKANTPFLSVGAAGSSPLPD
jgi:hypothetical protein